MLANAILGVRDIQRGTAFYDAVLGALGYVRMSASEKFVGYGTGQGKSQFFICIPRNGQPASNGNGTQVTFIAKDKASVDKFHAAALGGGGSDEGAPGYRPPDKKTSYGAYVRDPYGNKLMASCANPD
jgi:catechol 2,3-dioxygenase-like lactoylglutathione lyase family enzyme